MWRNLRTTARGAWRTVSTALINPPPAPAVVVRSALNRVSAILNSSASLSGSTETIPEYAQAELRRLSHDVFDVEHMARGALWRHWGPRNTGERAEFVRLFTDLLERLYVPLARQSRWVSVLHSSETVQGHYANVKWKVGTLRMTAAIEFRLRLRDGRWRIFDVRLNGHSFIASGRHELEQKIRSLSYAGVIREMPGWESLGFVGPALALAPTADAPTPARHGWSQARSM
jgi:phospholipid transport system substrate-binding protein